MNTAGRTSETSRQGCWLRFVVLQRHCRFGQQERITADEGPEQPDAQPNRHEGEPQEQVRHGTS